MSFLPQINWVQDEKTILMGIEAQLAEIARILRAAHGVPPVPAEDSVGDVASITVSTDEESWKNEQEALRNRPF